MTVKQRWRADHPIALKVARGSLAKPVSIGQASALEEIVA
jgi:hypothetical protein